jgi:hypothetical protein
MSDALLSAAAQTSTPTTQGSNGDNPASRGASQGSVRITIPPQSSQRSRVDGISAGGSRSGPEETTNISTREPQRTLDSFVEKCRSGEVSKAETTRQVLSLLDKQTTLPVETREKAFASYLTKIHSVRTASDRPGPTRGSEEGTTGGTLANPPPAQAISQSRPEPILASQENSERELDQIFRSLGSKRRSVGDNDEEEGDASGLRGKRPRLLQSDMPWFTARRSCSG